MISLKEIIKTTATKATTLAKKPITVNPLILGGTIIVSGLLGFGIKVAAKTPELDRIKKKDLYLKELDKITIALNELKVEYAAGNISKEYAMSQAKAYKDKFNLLRANYLATK